MSYCNWIS